MALPDIYMVHPNCLPEYSFVLLADVTINLHLEIHVIRLKAKYTFFLIVEVTLRSHSVMVVAHKGKFEFWTFTCDAMCNFVESVFCMVFSRPVLFIYCLARFLWLVLESTVLPAVLHFSLGILV